MENAKIFRIPKDRDYTCINNKHVFDSSISELASRLLTAVLALPDSWNFTISGMATMLARGRKAIRKAIANLVQSGYAYVEQPRNEKTGYFENNIYMFYEVPEVNPHLNPQQNQEISETPVNRDSIRVPKTEEPSRYDRFGTLSSTNKSNTDNESVGQVGRIDFSKQSENDNRIKREIATPQVAPTVQEKISNILMKNIDIANSEIKQFTEKVIWHLDKAISIDIIKLDVIIDKLKKIINVEHSLNSFIDKLQKICKKSLPNLKNPKAKNSFIRKVIVNQLKEYIPESANQKSVTKQSINASQQSSIQKSKTEKTEKEIAKEEITRKPLKFREMLACLNNPLLKEYGINDTIFDSEENFWSYFEDWEEAEARSCIIPEEIRNSQADMQNILKFLMGWHNIGDGNFKSFSEHAITYLAEVLKTGKCCGKDVNYRNLISYLNYINQGGKDEYEQETIGESICDFMECFFKHYCKQIEIYPPKSANKKGYITKMLISYLCGEYQAISAYASARMKNIDDTHHYNENDYVRSICMSRKI